MIATFAAGIAIGGRNHRQARNVIRYSNATYV